MRLTHTSLFLTIAASLACSRPATPPQSVVDAEALSRTPATLDTRTMAPQAKADADRRKKQALELTKAGKPEEAAIMGEQALAAYELAQLLSRSARAEARLDSGQRELSAKQEQLALLDGSQATLQGEVEALELRARVLLEAEPVADLKTMDSERLVARRRAAEKIASEAESLCLGARVLGSTSERLSGLDDQLKKLAEEFRVKGLNRDMYPRALELRAACLRELTSLRQEKSKSTPQVSLGDTLLKELTDNSFSAERDDRGVIAVFRDPADGPKLRDTTRSNLEKLTALLSGHKDVPALVIVHTGAPADDNLASSWLESATSLVKANGVTQVSSRSARGAEPLVDKRAKGSVTENRRIEVVLITPRF